RTVMLGLLVLGFLTGCSPAPQNGEPVDVGPISTPTGPTTTTMPFAAYIPDDDELQTLHKARNALVNACVAEFGLKGVLDTPADDSILADIRQGTDLPRTLEQAQRYGYRNAGSEAADTPAGKRQPSRVSAAERRTKMLVLNGPAAVASQGAEPPSGLSTPRSGQNVKVDGKTVPRGGCLGRSDRKLEQGAPDLDAYGAHGKTALNVLLGIRFEAWTKAAQDTAYRKMAASWSSCMKKAGFVYDSFKAAAEDPEWSRTRRAGDRETAVATADIRCRMQVNYLGVSEAVHLAYGKRAVEDNAELLRAVGDYYDTLVRNAAKAA
ncbi:hypothetical protein ACL02U_32035, partial [Streptomyces sp. MS06]|uniref:hypothetical protein n=1 Tax=Streptomyces sp. MS06 TaxID=3385974 RepID=UPI0039A0A062